MSRDKITTEPVALTCDTIGDLDSGIARALINAAILEAVNDLEDRGEEDEKTRKVTIELEMAKDRGLTVVRVAAQAKLPPRRSNMTSTKPRMAGKSKHELLFQVGNADNPDQPTLDYEENNR